MTKRTRKSALAVFEYCVKAALKAKKEGLLVLEELRLEKGLTDTGKFLFSKKVDKFLYSMVSIILEGGYSQEVNKNYAKSLSKYSYKKTKLLLNVSSTCMDCIANGKELNKLVVDIIPYIGVDNQKPFWDLFYELKAQDEKDFEYKLTEEQKKRIVETNVFFKMKEDECNTLLKQKNEKLTELHSRVPELKKQVSSVQLEYKPTEYKYGLSMYMNSIPESDCYVSGNSRKIWFIGEIPVCYSTYRLWNDSCNVSHDIKKFMNLTDDIPNNIEKNLIIQSSIELLDE